MTDAERELLEKHGVVALPEILDHDGYLLILSACLMRPDDPITLYCRGNGGSCRTANAIVDLVREHGQVRGVLLSEANSSHAVIFAGCPERYVYPHGLLGIHRTALEDMYHVDAPYARWQAEESDANDRYNAAIFAEACRGRAYYGVDFWYGEIEKAGSRGLKQFNAKFLIDCGMAVPVSEMPRLTQKVAV